MPDLGLTSDRLDLRCGQAIRNVYCANALQQSVIPTNLQLVAKIVVVLDQASQLGLNQVEERVTSSSL
jgi:hypothetical protein